ELRRSLTPLGDTAVAAAAALAEICSGLPGLDTPAMLGALASVLADRSGQPIRVTDFDTARLPPHLHTHLVVVDADGAVVDAGDDLAALAARQAGSARAAVAQVAPIAERHDITSWDVGTLDQVIEQ